MVLFALVDAHYSFLFVSIGKPGSANDAQIWNDSTLKRALDDGSLVFPKSDGQINYHLIGDDIFPLTIQFHQYWIRKPQNLISSILCAAI